MFNYTKFCHLCKSNDSVKQVQNKYCLFCRTQNHHNNIQYKSNTK